MSADLHGLVAAQPRRTVSGEYWHQGATRLALTAFADPANSDGRYHRSGGPGVWYASDQEQAAWAELFRHFIDGGIDPFEIRRRIGKVVVNGVDVLDLTDPAIRTALDLELGDLQGDDYYKTQDVAEAAAAAGFGGILAPSAALPGRRTLVVFPLAVDRITPHRSRVASPPPRLADLLPAIRPHPDVPTAVRRLLHRIAAAGSETVRRRRAR